MLLNISCHKHRPLSTNMNTNMIKWKRRLVASAALPPRVTKNTHSLQIHRDRLHSKSVQCALLNFTRKLRRCLNSLCIKLANTHPGRANVPHVHKMCASGWLVGWCARWMPDMRYPMCSSSKSSALGKALDVLVHTREVHLNQLH